MAYDQNAPYQAPRRAYQPQAHPQAPVRTTHAQYQADEYGNYDQGYEQEYRQNIAGGYHDYNASDQRTYEGQGWQGNGGYEDTYASHGYPEQQSTHGTRHAPQDRTYDPRYQPRGARNPAGQVQHKGLQSRPPPERQGYQIQPHNRANPPVQAVRSNGTKEQYDRPGTRGGGPPRSRSDHQSRGRDSGNTSMADWKAQEKAKMTAAAASPNYLPQDNAFPKFENPNARPATSEGKGSARSSEDQRRAGSRRPAESRGKSNSSSTATSVDRPSAHDRRPSTGPSAVHHVSEPERQRDRARTYQNEPTYSQPAPSRVQATGYVDGGAVSDRHEQRDWPLSQPPPVQSDGFAPRYDTSSRARPDPPAGGSHPPTRPSEQSLRQRPLERHPPVQPIMTQPPQSGPAFLDHHPLTPVDVIPRPATASGAQRFPIPQYASAASHQPSSATVETYATPKPWMQHSKHESLDDLYDGYGTSGDPQFASPKTRDEEIEDEMPDFDNAGVESSSSMHKRTKTVDRHLGEVTTSPPPMPPIPSQISNERGQQYRGAQRDFTPQSESNNPHRALPPGRSSHDHPAREPPRAADPYKYQTDHRGPAHQEYADAQYTQPMRPPFANEDFGRRSMDDARQAPHRPAPPQGQRFYQQSPPGIESQSHSQQARPAIDRNGTGLTTWSDPGQQRGPSVPPTGHSLRQPPNGSRTKDSTTQDRRPDPTQSRQSDPDALPHHPTPVRPGLMDSANAQPSRPVPVRNYNNTTRDPPSAPAQNQPRQSSDDPFAQSVTREELNRLRAAVDSNPGNPKQALLLAKKLVEAGAVLASENGRLDQKSTAKNRERYIMEGYKRVKKMVASGYPEAQFYLADCYGQGLLGLEVDTKEAFNLYQAAAKQGHAQAAYRTAICCELGSEDGGGTRRDYAKAMQWHRRAAALGDPAAMFKLGAVLLKGMLGQQKNIGEAVTWLKRAAERADADHPHALHELAGLYDSVNTNPEIRNKVLADDKHARELFQQAAAFGYKFSQFRLGQAYEYGTLGVVIDNRQSITWYTKAAAQGEHQAELALSGWYLTGAGGILEHSDTEAYLWARKAAMSEPPLAKALFAMGYFTETGIGCPASLEEAKKWYGRAASLKFPKALERLEELKKNGGKNSRPANGRLTRHDQKRDEAECVIM